VRTSELREIEGKRPAPPMRSPGISSPRERDRRIRGEVLGLFRALGAVDLEDGERGRPAGRW
jgi:hypothetical protein